MTQIKKFAWYGSALALAAVAAVALLVLSPATQAEADVTNIGAVDINGGDVEPGDLLIIGAEYDSSGSLLFEVLDPGAEFVDNGSDTLPCANGDVSCDIAAAVPGVVAVHLQILDTATAGEIRVRATDDAGLGGADSVVIDVVVQPNDPSSIDVSGPASIADGGSALFSVDAIDADGERTVATAEVQAVNGLLATDGAGNCLAADVPEIDRDVTCDLETNDSGDAAQVLVYEDGEVGENVQVNALVNLPPLVFGSAQAPIVGPAASITVDAAASVQTGSVTAFTVAVNDANDNPVADGTAVTVVSSEGVVNCLDNTTDDGEISCVFVAPGDPANVVITATSGAALGTTAVQVVVTDDVLSPPVADSGISLTVVVNDSTIEEVVAAAGDPISIWITVDGEFVGYIPGAPDFVNAGFVAETGGELASGTPIVVVK